MKNANKKDKFISDSDINNNNERITFIENKDFKKYETQIGEEEFNAELGEFFLTKIEEEQKKDREETNEDNVKTIIKEKIVKEINSPYFQCLRLTKKNDKDVVKYKVLKNEIKKAIYLNSEELELEEIRKTIGKTDTVTEETKKQTILTNSFSKFFYEHNDLIIGITVFLFNLILFYLLGRFTNIIAKIFGYEKKEEIEEENENNETNGEKEIVL